MKLKILVVGAGAIGGFVGGSLAADGHQVTLLGRPPLMEKIGQVGLTLCWPDGSSQTVTPRTTTSLDRLSAGYHFILLTVKRHDVGPAIEQLAAHAPLVGAAHIVCLQNGIGSEEQVAAAFGSKKVIAGTVTLPIGLPEPGVVEVSKAKGGLGLAPLDPSQPLGRLAAALNQAGLPTPCYADYRAMKWSKLLLNIVNNATCAILDQPPARVITDPDLFNLEIEALREAVAVMKAQGLAAVKLPGYSVDWLAWLVSARRLPLVLIRAILRPYLRSGRGTKMPSLQLDLAAGRPVSEINALNGAIVQAGQQLDIPTPVNQTLTEILNGLVSGELAWGDYRRQPEKLFAASRVKMALLASGSQKN